MGCCGLVVQKVAASDELDLQLVVTARTSARGWAKPYTKSKTTVFPSPHACQFLPTTPTKPVACTIARTINVFDSYFAAHRPDTVLLLGDRFEIFAVATTAAARHIPIAHISGGDVTLGAADEYYRHCISKMAAVHFPSCADSAARLVRMAKRPTPCSASAGWGMKTSAPCPK